jgi:ABC-type multidrug transport system ATPase subunit
MVVIETEGLTKLYGEARGIEDVTFTVGAGEVFGFLGPNRAGKTTTIRARLRGIGASLVARSHVDRHRAAEAGKERCASQGQKPP